MKFSRIFIGILKTAFPGLIVLNTAVIICHFIRRYNYSYEGRIAIIWYLTQTNMDKTLRSKRERTGRINFKRHRNKAAEYLKLCYKSRNA